MQKARRHWLYQLRQLVSEQFQVLFHSSTRSAFHLSLTVLVHYRSLGSIQPYRMVPANSRRIPRAPRYSGYYYQSYTYLYGAFTLCGLTFQTGSSSYTSQISQSYNPTQRRNVSGLGYSAFARHYQRNHNCFLFLRVLRCFSSPRSPLNKGNQSSTDWVAPFGNLRIKGRLHLPEAYRSLPRPSSPPRAKASTVRSCFLFL